MQRKTRNNNSHKPNGNSDDGENPVKTVLEFFAGIGLMRMGLERQGWSVVYANDIAPDKVEIYHHNFPENKETFWVGDIHKIDPSTMPSAALATASFPCNDLSVAGARAGLEGKQSSAFWGFVEILQGMGERRPPIVLLENVVGFLTSHGGNDFRLALQALNELGYSVDTMIVDAERFVPQSRKRLFVIGALNREGVERPLVFETDVRPRSLIDFIMGCKGIKWNIRTLPPLPSRTDGLSSILENLPADAKEWWSEERAVYLLNQMSPKHRELAEKMMSRPNWSYGTVFRRVRRGKSMAELRVDGIAGCLRTPRGGSGRQILFAARKNEYRVRLLTARECARLMGANEFKVEVPLNQALFGFGDAVCVPVIHWIAANYLDPLLTELSAKRRP
ncbi:MAG: DNA (cytosine-5-)-methyltransferase [Verrucomicrobiota bacterium]